ncbi:twin-arginine translocase subunit TatB [Pacificimonas flava]|uniref:Twin-arginine translocase subunit TatB n=2 Tax=Pacificimonas TaxID=1960290 RepID=A0A219B253_9SPHN|nr:MULTISPECIES: Sec-independent protein translocase protein TatB [Pacificimonas]MBZ6377952.1 twin-arginine translocase subunit TatB [Pacificimonas aurantium]OWV32395.1 twin-arginine translocase subunit TatB [Pacificimonas flava]
MPFFDLGGFELFFIAIVALLVVGPKDLPRVMRTVGRAAAKVRGTARHFKSGMDEMIRQAELDEMREKWDRHNAEIMRAHPNAQAPGLPDPPPSSAPKPPEDGPPPSSSETPGTAPGPSSPSADRKGEP